MKKLILILLTSMLVISGCNKEKEITITESVTSLLHNVVTKASVYDKDDEYGLASIEVEDHKITEEDCETVLGLSKEDFKKYVKEAVESKVTQSWYNHSIVAVELNDGVDYKTISEKIIKNTDPGRFGCLKADKIEGAYYNKYLVFAASTETIVDNTIKAFNEITSNKAKVITRENNWNESFFE